VIARQQASWPFERTGSQANERAHLVRQCRRLTGDPDVAEDLAQESLARAYRPTGPLPEPEWRLPWLLGIARHVCLDWIRRQQRERAHILVPRSMGEVNSESDETLVGIDALADRVADDFDVEVELERAELTELLDRALALLPAESREVLVARYVEESSLADLARRLGASEGAVAMRLQRGKLRLRRLLQTRLRPEAETLGVLPERGNDLWNETRIWCPFCGRRHLIGRFDDRVYQLRCPDCDAAPGVFLANADLGDLHGLLDGVSQFKPALSRLSAWTHRSVHSTLSTGRGTCERCGAPATAVLRMPEDGPPSLRDLPGLTTRCRQCGWLSANGLGIVVLTLPEVQRFWKDYPRLQSSPRREVETAGVPALVSRLESVTEAAAIEVITTRATHQVLSIHRSDRS
jgi:RNA polymerase sigma-70 factor (ECF subfamily)